MCVCVFKYWTHRLTATLARPPGRSGPCVSGDVGVLGDGAGGESLDPEEHGRPHTRLCDLQGEDRGAGMSPKP